jgi:hypothetical protein
VYRAAVLLIVFTAVLSANPTMEYFISEVQVAPDSLERVELHMYSHERQYPVDLSGWQIVTNAGIATIDSGVVLEDSTDFAVISRENSTGTFSLGDSADSIALPAGDCEPFVYGRDGWTPPAGMSSAAYTFWTGVYPDLYQVCEWYLDATPTFGAPNDDHSGGIAGRVLDRFGQPLPWCTVTFSNLNGHASVGCDSTDGHYYIYPLGPGTYQVSARSDSTYLPAYCPDSVTIAADEWRDSINMTMYPAGVAEEPGRATSQCFLHQCGRSLVLNADRPGTAVVTVFDNLGRVRMSEKMMLASGSNELALPALRSGIFFVSCRFGGQTLKTKLVLY